MKPDKKRAASYRQYYAYGARLKLASFLAIVAAIFMWIQGPLVGFFVIAVIGISYAGITALDNPAEKARDKKGEHRSPARR